jgi:hypothetical protein
MLINTHDTSVQFCEHKATIFFKYGVAGEAVLNVFLYNLFWGLKPTDSTLPSQWFLAPATWAETVTQSKKTRRIRKKTTKTLLRWNVNTLFMRHAFTPNDFQMHQQWLDHSYCKRETSLTKLKNSKSMMIFVVRLVSSPTRVFISFQHQLTVLS